MKKIKIVMLCSALVLLLSFAVMGVKGGRAPEQGSGRTLQDMRFLAEMLCDGSIAIDMESAVTMGFDHIIDNYE
jgi:hypothetical protein